MTAKKVQLISWRYVTTNTDTLSMPEGNDFMANLKTIDAETLPSQPMRQPPFLVDSLLASGLYILAGVPKVGKS